MKRRNLILIISFVVLTLISIKPKAQTSQCDCWKQRDNSFTEYPFNLDISGPVPTSPYYRNDDAYGTSILTLPFSFCFYGQQVNQIYINNNGFVTWGPGANAMNSGSSSYEPQTLPLPTVQLISAFWSDEDTRNVSGPVSNGLVFYKVTPTYIIIQWDTVSYYGTYTSSQDNSFQMIISDGNDPIIPNGNNIEFCYQQMQWAVGNAQAGNSGFDSQINPAEVGINQGNGVGNIQYGLFNTATSNYTGPYPSSPYDGVYWLDNREFIMNGCTGNAPPFEMSGSTVCDTLKICQGDTVKTSYDFYSVLTGSNVTTVLGTPLSGVSIIYNVAAGPSDSVVVQIVGNSTNTGIHTIVLYSFDNISPADTLFTDIVIDISPAPPVTISAVKDTICLGNSAVLTAGGGLTYSWSTGGTTPSITVTPTVTTTYSVAISTNSCTKDTTVTVVVEPPVALAVTPANVGICTGDSLSIKVTGATSYSWAPATGLNCSTCSSVKASPSVTTIYTVTGISNGCSTTITDTVTVNPLPTVSIIATADSICQAQPDTLVASGAAIYSWLPATGLSCSTCANPIATPTISTQYTVTGTTAQGCSSTATVSIVVFPLPALTVSPNVSVCAGRSVSLLAAGDGTSFTWTPGNITGPVINVTPATTQTYTVTMTSGCGNVVKTVTVYVNPLPTPKYSADVLAGCSPFCTQFRNKSTITAGSLNSWTWEFGNGDTSDVQSPIYCYQTPGKYSVKITCTSDSGCSASLLVNDYITVYSHPNAAFTLSPQPTTILQSTIQFTDNATDIYGLAFWQWNFGDAADSTSTLKNPPFTYQDTGTYCVSEVVTNIHGCVDTTTNCLIISPAYTLYIPSAFSPNGDKYNEIFAPKGNDIKSFEMYIFDRWGMQLFHSSDIANGWNGTVKGNGTICQEDTYVYMITVYDSKNIKHSYTGSINLIK